MPKRRRPYPPTLEGLERRLLLSVVTADPRADHRPSGGGIVGIPAAHRGPSPGEAVHARPDGRGMVSRASVRGAAFDAGYRFVPPLSTLSIAGSFDPGARTTVIFTPLSGPRIRETPDSLSAGQVTVAVPFALSARTGRLDSRGYSVAVVQSDSRGHETRTAAVYHLQIKKPPATDLAPGAVLNAMLEGEQYVLRDEIAKAQLVDTLDPGQTATASLAASLQSESGILRRSSSSSNPSSTAR